LQNIRISRFFVQLFGLAFLIRLPFFFRDYIDWDETTFLLVAQSWAEGHLPYTELWDLKPPITFLYFTLQLLLFGKSLFMIRFMGVFLVAGSAWFTYRLADQIRPEMHLDYKRITAVLVVLLWSLFGTLQGVMSEHISTFFFLGGLLLLTPLNDKTDWRKSLGAGVLMGLALMAKVNFAYAIMALGLYQLYTLYQAKQLFSWSKHWLNPLCWGMGVVLVIVLTYLPYVGQGLGTVWWRSVIEAPMAYGDVQSHSWEAALVCAPVAGLLIYGLFRQGTFGAFHPSRLLVFALLGVLFSFVQAGRINGHYLIQAYPFMVLLLLSVLPFTRSPLQKRGRQWALVLLLLIPVEAYREYGLQIQHTIETGRLSRGESFELQQYLEEQGYAEASVFFLHYHTTSFLMGTKPLNRAGTHPSNLTRDALFPFMENPRQTSEAEIDFIFLQQQPQFVVVKTNKIFSNKFPELNQQIQDYLDKDYQEEVVLGRALMYKRKAKP